jgi:hypothetical protein
MFKKIKENPFLYLSILFVLILMVATIQNGFFWDTVQLGSKHANFYFTTNFNSLLLPEIIDSGHIPTFGMYIALIWKIFGRNLIVSHLAMLPFVIGIIWQLNIVIKTFFKTSHSGFVLFLILLDPTLLSQMTLISPDVLLVFLFLLGLNSVLKNHKISLLFSVFFLFLVSMRGMMVAFCLLIIDVFLHINFKNSFKHIFHSLLRRSAIYLPSLLLFVLFSIYHYIEKGWIGFHEDSPWADCFTPVDFNGFIYNIGILGWRLLDFGRVGIWFVFILLFLKYRKEIFEDKQTRILLFIFICFIVILPANMLWAKNLLGHRYLLPIFLTFSLLTSKILFSINTNIKLRRILVSIWFVVLLSGNFWIYPNKISQGWDSTLAHLPYYELRKEVIKYFDNQNIDINEVQTFFPDSNIIDDIDLNGDFRKFKKFENGNGYVMYSNIHNVSDDIYDTLITKYLLVKEFKNKSVFFKIYKKVEMN